MIQGNELRDALISGANAILKHKTQVDELNIFPFRMETPVQI